MLQESPVGLLKWPVQSVRLQGLIGDQLLVKKLNCLLPPEQDQVGPAAVHFK